MKKLIALKTGFWGGSLREAGKPFEIPDNEATPPWAAPADEVEVVPPANVARAQEVAMSQIVRMGVGDNPLDAMERARAAVDATKPTIKHKPKPVSRE